MKNIFLLACMTVAATTISNGQTPKNEVHGGIGAWSSSAIINMFSNIIVNVATGGLYTNDATYSAVTHLGYKYRAGMRTVVGGTYSYSYGKSDAFIDGDPAGDFRNNYHTFAAEFEYHWLSGHKFSLYSTLGAGATFLRQKYSPLEGDAQTDNKAHFNFQFSPAGIKNGENYGLFAEAGFGYKGIISGGFFGRF